MSKVFRVNYQCGNCGKEWSEEYEKGVIIKNLSEGPYEVGPMKWLKCPCCTMANMIGNPQIHIVSREPVTEIVEHECPTCGAERSQELEREG